MVCAHKFLSGGIAVSYVLCYYEKKLSTSKKKKKKKRYFYFFKDGLVPLKARSLEGLLQGAT